MKARWEYGTLQDVLQKGSSNLTLKKVAVDDGEHPVFGAKGIVGKISTYQQESEFLSVIKDGAGIGRVAVCPERSSVLATLQILTPKKGFDTKFLYYFLESIDLAKKYRVGSTIPHIYFKNYKHEPVPLLKLEEQKRIVAILDEAFEGLDRARTHTKANLQNAKELFESELNIAFSNNDSSWTTDDLEELCGKITDGTHQTPKYFENGYMFLSSKNVKNGVLDWENIKYIDEKQHIAMQKRLAPRMNDILLRKNGAGYGKAAIVDRDVIFDVYVSLAVLRPLEKILPKYLLLFLNSNIAMKQFSARIKGQGVPNLHLQEIRKVLVSYPIDLKKQKEIVVYFETLQKNTKLLEQSYQTKLNDLDDLRQSLLQKAFAGELS